MNQVKGNQFSILMIKNVWNIIIVSPIFTPKKAITWDYNIVCL